MIGKYKSWNVIGWEIALAVYSPQERYTRCDHLHMHRARDFYSRSVQAYITLQHDIEKTRWEIQNFGKG